MDTHEAFLCILHVKTELHIRHKYIPMYTYDTYIFRICSYPPGHALLSLKEMLLRIYLDKQYSCMRHT